MADQKKAAYIDLLMELAKDKDGSEASSRMDLLDRLERAIGISTSGTIQRSE